MKARKHPGIVRKQRHANFQKGGNIGRESENAKTLLRE
jgi:hypothetical protein